MAPARARDPAAADLPLLGDVPPQLRHVLVVDLRDLLLAEVAIAPLDRPCRAAGPLALLLLSLARHQNGMSSSVAAGKSAVDSAPAPAGTNWLPPPKSPPPSPRLPRNCTDSATISTDSRLPPSCPCHSRQSSRPSTATGRPFDRYCAQLSAWLPKTEMLK